MKAQLKAVLENTTINFDFDQVVKCPWSDSDKNVYRQRYNIELVKDGKRVIKAPFYDSIVNYNLSVNGESVDQGELMLNALHCLISDALCYQSSIDLHDFIIEMGYLSKDDLAIAESAIEMDEALKYALEYDSIIEAYNDCLTVYRACMHTFKALNDNYDFEALVELTSDY